MERFKFRAWDKKLEEYYDPLDIDANGFYAKIKGQSFELDLFANDLKKNSIEIEQYTGIKDSHGKPIFDGDILLMEEDNQKRIVYVDFRSGAFCLQDGPFCVSFFDITTIDTGNFERGIKITVVGNIHMNDEEIDKLYDLEEQQEEGE